MSGYEQMKKAMQAGTPLELICTACPWDRLCITPPTMSAAEIEQQLRQAERQDAERIQAPGAKAGRMPVNTLMTAMLFAGKDTSGQLCPVFAARLRSPEGRGIADAIRTAMQRFGEPQGGVR